MRAFFVRALYGKYAELFKENGYAAIGWFKDKAPDYSTREAIIEHYRKEYSNDSDARTYQNVGQIYRFWNEINNGDIVVSTHANGDLIVGKAKGEPYFVKDSFKFYERIDVDWNPEIVNRHLLPIGLQNTLKSSLTVFSISQVDEIAKAAGFKTDKKIEIQNKIFNENDLYEAIRSQILTLDAYEFELLVSKILQTLGFEATQETGRSGDGGIDYEGVLDVNGVASVKLQVQVKRYESNKITDIDIRNFRGSLKRDYQGTFISLSSFNKKAIEGASNPHMESIKLINGNQFIDLFILQYDEIMNLLNEEESNLLQGKLQFKKTLIPIIA